MQLTSLLRDRMPRRAWHAVHLTSHVPFWLATGHAALAGTDQGNRLSQVTGAAAAAAAVVI